MADLVRNAQPKGHRIVKRDSQGRIESRPLQDRFWALVDRHRDGCWLWMGSRMHNGYGQFKKYPDGRSQSAHRVAYELAIGPIPQGLDLDHLCRVRHCVNPEHLDPVSRGENLRRSPLTGPGMNIRKTACPKGHSYATDNDGHRYCPTCKTERRKGKCDRCGKVFVDLRQHIRLEQCRA
jgi:hypothetical protein